MKKLILVALVGAAIMATVAAAKPPPPPPVQVLGIPHFVHQIGLLPEQQENHVRCPAGEVAVSITFSMPGPMQQSTVYAHPTLLDGQGRPNGYRVWVVASGISLNATLLCAPVVSVQPSS